MAPPPPSMVGWLSWKLCGIAGTNQQARVRLFGSVAGIGFVQVRAPNGTYGFVCDDGWDTNAAKVVCAELCYK